MLECPLWVVSGHSEARKLPDARIAAENASVSVCFRPEADIGAVKKNPAVAGFQEGFVSADQS